MTCEQARVAISAALDGEDLGVPATVLAEHLSSCPACRRWRHEAAQVTRRARLAPVAVPDLTGEILAEMARRQHSHHRARSRSQAPHRVLLVRALLAAVALGQAATAVSVLAGGILAPGEMLHTSHELGTLNLALAVGMGWAAWRPRAAGALVPVMASSVLVLAAITVPDLLAGRTTLAAESAHLGLAAGLALVASLAWSTRATPSPSGQPRAHGDGSVERTDEDGPGHRISPAA